MLKEVVIGLKPTRIISSPYVRCVQTVAPTAKETGLKVGRSAALVPTTPLKALRLVRKLSTPKSKSGTVICTHGEVLGAILSDISKSDGVKLGRRPPGAKGSIWVLDFRRGKLVAAEYISPTSMTSTPQRSATSSIEAKKTQSRSSDPR